MKVMLLTVLLLGIAICLAQSQQQSESVSQENAVDEPPPSFESPDDFADPPAERRKRIAVPVGARKKRSGSQSSEEADQDDLFGADDAGDGDDGQKRKKRIAVPLDP